MNERTVCPWSGCTHGRHADEAMDLCKAVKDLCSCKYWIFDTGYWITGYCDIQSLSIYVDWLCISQQHIQHMYQFPCHC